METAGGSDSEERRMSKARTEHGAARSPGSTSKKMQPAKKSKKSATAKRKKPKDMPRRPLSAYNIFFREERRRILEEREAGQLGQVTSLFSTMGKEIARRWKKLSPEQIVKYADLANQDMERYRREMELYNLGVRTFDKKAKPAPTLPGATSPPPAGVQSAVRGINDLLTAGAVLDAAPGRGSQAAMSPGPRFDVASRLSEQVAPAATALDITRLRESAPRPSGSLALPPPPLPASHQQQIPPSMLTAQRNLLSAYAPNISNTGFDFAEQQLRRLEAQQASETLRRELMMPPPSSTQLPQAPLGSQAFFSFPRMGGNIPLSRTPPGDTAMQNFLSLQQQRLQQRSPFVVPTLTLPQLLLLQRQQSHTAGQGSVAAYLSQQLYGEHPPRRESTSSVTTPMINPVTQEISEGKRKKDKQRQPKTPRGDDEGKM